MKSSSLLSLHLATVAVIRLKYTRAYVNYMYCLIAWGAVILGGVSVKSYKRFCCRWLQMMKTVNIPDSSQWFA